MKFSLETLPTLKYPGIRFVELSRILGLKLWSNRKVAEVDSTYFMDIFAFASSSKDTELYKILLTA
eukprot:snap_masked-scaffold_4-processed-gene-14.38-mRNA-1 protein AED:1.00 eAED:1.00 QI:0/0/0/0/1/1/2/0/65